MAFGLEIRLSRRALVGGICFGGYPYAPYRILSTGENASNFGLPREIRLSAQPRSGDARHSGSLLKFPDADAAVTRQELLSHAGIQFIACDPTLTDSILLRVSDLPSFATQIDGRGEVLEERFGFAIPYFWVFEYKETTRYHPGVRAALIGARAGVDDIPPGSPVVADATLVDHQHESGAPGNPTVCTFSATSVFGQQRRYELPADGPGGRAQTLDECFISKPVAPGDGVTLYITQTEEFERCIAGIRLLVPFVPEVHLAQDLEALGNVLTTLLGTDVDLSVLANLPLESWLREHFLRIPSTIDFCEKLEVRVFEIDPPDGVSPVAVPLDGKYATLLAERRIDDLSEMLNAMFVEGIRFKRTSLARHFALQLINRDTETAQFVVKRLELLQSAHVSINPRPAKAQQVRALHFRLIAPNLAEDYAKLGTEGFNLAVERLVAGEPKSVLFRACSLIDLLDSGVARLYNNVRRRAVEEDYSVVVGGAEDNFDRRTSGARSSGWRRSQTGEGPQHPIPREASWVGDAAPGAFAMQSTQETRTHTEFVGPPAANTRWQGTALVANAVHAMFQPATTASAALGMSHLGPSWSTHLIPTFAQNPLTAGWGSVWSGVDPTTLAVEGLRTVTASPYGVNHVTQQLLEAIEALRNQDPLLAAKSAADILLQVAEPRMYALAMLNSFGVGVSAALLGVGLNLSTSTGGGMIIPSVSFVNTIGSQGTIARQATLSGYQYAQHRNDSFDETTGTSAVLEGRSHHRIVRKDPDGFDTERTRGGEVLWQGRLVDIVTGTIPLNLTLPATASRMNYRTVDEGVRVRLGNGVGRSVSVDVWFDVLEETVKDDH